MATYSAIKKELMENPRTWLITGCAGFIGSNLLEALLKLNQKVVGLDNFSTGFQRNLDEVRSFVSPEQWGGFRFRQGDIRNLEDCRKACAGVQIVLHQAALGSVPRSIEDPINTNSNNIDGFLNMLVAARDAPVKRFVYAASSSTYGDHPALPKSEDVIGRPLSPYAVTKYVNELYADVFVKTYGMEIMGLRYFNVFGPRQDPKGGYAAVIPKWYLAMVSSEPVSINGDGQTSRDFCYIENCVQANLQAALSENPEALNQVYNIACGERTTLLQLFEKMKDTVFRHNPHARQIRANFGSFRPGDIRHSLADIGKARGLLGYEPEYGLSAGLDKASGWYLNFCRSKGCVEESAICP